MICNQSVSPYRAWRESVSVYYEFLSHRAGSEFEGCGFVSTSQLNDEMAADRVLIEAARGLITCQALLSRLMEMIHMKLYEEEVSGAR
jgi:hypothetical protein